MNTSLICAELPTSESRASVRTKPDLELDDERVAEAIAEVRFVDTLILSDIHLGSDVSRSRDALRMIRSYSFSRLILNGDVFEDLNFKRLRKDDWKFLSHIRRLSNPKRGVEVVWVAGNHDGIAEILTHLLGVDVCDEYMWEEDGERYLAIHGHQFDRFLSNNMLLSEIATVLYKFFQRIDSDDQRVSRWMKRRSKTWLRVSDAVATAAIEYARARGAKFVFCGHTHQPIDRLEGGVRYLNSGCWTDYPAHYITIDRANGMQIAEYM